MEESRIVSALFFLLVILVWYALLVDSYIVCLSYIYSIFILYLSYIYSML